MKKSIRNIINILQSYNNPIIIGYIGLLLSIFYYLSRINKIFVILILIGKTRYLFQLLKKTPLDLINMLSSSNIDYDIIYLIYKNRNDNTKLSNILESYPDIKYIIKKPLIEHLYIRQDKMNKR